MRVKSIASLLAALASRRAATLLAPAILILGTTLAVGQSSAPPLAPTTSEAPTATAPSSAFTPTQRKEIEAIIKDILLNNPEVLLEAQNALEATGPGSAVRVRWLTRW